MILPRQKTFSKALDAKRQMQRLRKLKDAEIICRTPKFGGDHRSVINDDSILQKARRIWRRSELPNDKDSYMTALEKQIEWTRRTGKAPVASDHYILGDKKKYRK